MDQNGYLLIKRRIWQDEDFKCLSPSQRLAYIQLLFKANHNINAKKRCRWCKTEQIINPGQIFSSIKNLAEEFESKYMSYYRKIHAMSRVNLIEIDTVKCHTTLTILNYEEICGYGKPTRKPKSKPSRAIEDNTSEGHYICNTKSINNTVKQINEVPETLNAFSSPLCDALKNAILSKYPDHRLGKRKWKGSANRKSWCIVADKLLRIDKVDYSQALLLIGWIFNESDFWAPNIQSMTTFRKQYDKLCAQMDRDTTNSKPASHYEFNFLDSKEYK